MDIRNIVVNPTNASYIASAAITSTSSYNVVVAVRLVLSNSSSTATTAGSTSNFEIKLLSYLHKPA